MRYLFAVALSTQLFGCPHGGTTAAEDEVPEGTISLEEALESVDNENQESSDIAAETQTETGGE